LRKARNAYSTNMEVLGRLRTHFFKIELSSATSIESSRRDLLNNMIEHRPILKNNQNMYHPNFGFTPRTGIVSPKRVLFLLCTVF